MSRLFPPTASTAVLALALLMTPVWSSAASVTVPYSGGSLTVTYPDSYTSCNPADLITVSGITAGHPITIYFHRFDETLNLAVPLGSVTADADGSWAFPYPAVTGTTYFTVTIEDNTTDRVLKGYKWSITCQPTTGGEGCTPGFWRNHYEAWPAPYAPATSFNAAFGIAADYFAPGFFANDYTLRDAIWQGGGGLNRLARHGAAALLSAASPSVAFPYTVAEVIAMVQSGTIDPLAQANELGCPIQ